MSAIPKMNHEEARAAIQVRSGGQLSAVKAAALRHHLMECTECRTIYDRGVMMRRLAAGNDVETALPVESSMLLQEVLGQVRATPAPAAAPFWRHWQWAAVAAAAAVVLMVVVPWKGVPNDSQVPSKVIQERGAVRVLAGAGIGLSGVDGRGAEYEVVESNGICREDALRFYVNRRAANFRSYFIFGVDGDGALHWYAPLPEELTSYSLPETLGVPTKVPFEIVLEEKHPLGPLVVVALFSEEPLEWAAVSPLVATHATNLLESPEEGARLLASKLGVDVLPATRLTRIITCGGKQ